MAASSTEISAMDDRLGKPFDITRIPQQHMREALIADRKLQSVSENGMPFSGYASCRGLSSISHPNLSPYRKFPRIKDRGMNHQDLQKFLQKAVTIW